ncbi:MAG: response regulator, partial [Bacteroidota bacterium]|nr:response regulator [Bacteroidota bacterium]
EISMQRDRLTELNKKVVLINQIKLRFFTNISHEFKTPLTLIIDPLEELISEWKGDKKIYDSLLLIRRNAMRLLFLINQLMDFRKIETNKLDLKVSEGDLGEFLHNIYLSFDLLARQKQIEYNFQKQDVEYKTWFDHEKIEKIIFNLLSNAFKYTPQGGKVILSLSIPEDKGKLDFSHSEGSSKSCPYAEIMVSDTGMGIPVEHLNNIFKRFYRVDSPENNRINGSGIGLSIANELVKVHHGQISVESQVGKGSVFKIRIPFLKESYSTSEIVEEENKTSKNNMYGAEMFTEEVDGTDNPIPAPAKRMANDNHKPVIMVVEDNYDLRSFIANSLSEEYKVIEAGNGKEAYDLVNTHSADLVISDIMMPEMDGLELCSRIKNNLLISHIPVILLTARSSVENLIEGLETGADDYISKPFNFNVLKVKIKNILEARRKLKEHYSKDLNVDPVKLSHSPVDEKFLSKALEIVHENYSNPDFGVEIFAEQMNISRSLLHKKLSALTDFSAGDFITSVRLKKAAELLHQPDKNISDVAYEVGFNDPKYFSRIFKKYFGTTPTGYINN